MADRPDRSPMVRLAGVYENVSKTTGKRYFTAYVGAAKLLMLPTKDAKEHDAPWTLFLVERSPKPDAKP